MGEGTVHPNQVGRLTRRTLLTLLATTPAQAQPCTPLTTIRLRIVDGLPIVPATIAGTRVSLVLDTGAQGMLVTPAIAQALALPLRGMTRVFGTGGAQPARVVLLPGLRLGNLPMPETLSPVAPLPIDLALDPPLAGLLGASLLARFDLDIDAPAGRLSLAFPADCPVPPGGTTLPLEVSPAGEPYLPVTINGQPLLALLDTGSRATILTGPTARRLRIAAPRSDNTAIGIDGLPQPIGNTTVQLALGDEPAVATAVSIAPLQLERGDLLLGMDIIRHRRLHLSYAAGRATFFR